MHTENTERTSERERERVKKLTIYFHPRNCFSLFEKKIHRSFASVFCINKNKEIEGRSNYDQTIKRIFYSSEITRRSYQHPLRVNSFRNRFSFVHSLIL